MTITIGVLLSGTGTNLQAILDAIAARKLDAEVGVVVSNVASAGGLKRAEDAHVPTKVVDHRQYVSRKEFDAKVVEVLEKYKVQWVVLAGFMRVVTERLLDAFPMRIINIHPSLLPAFPGLNAQSQAFSYGSRITGCTMHFVDGGTDTGPIIAQCAVPVLADDTDDELRKRILVEEHRLLVDVLQWIAENRVTVQPDKKGGRARVLVKGRQTFRLARTTTGGPPSSG